MADYGGRRRGIQHEVEDLGNQSTTNTRGPRWIVRTGHSQPGGYLGLPATQARSARGAVGAKGPPPPTYPAHSTEVSWTPAGSSQSDGGGQDALGLPDGEGSPCAPACPGASDRVAEGGVALQMMLNPPAAVPVACIQMPVTPDPGWSTPSPGRGTEEGPSSSQASEGTPLPWRLSYQPSIPSPKPMKAPQEAVEETGGKRRAPQRQSARVKARNVAAAAATAAAVDSDPNPITNDAYRLALEHTYIQGDENRLCGLLEDLRKVRAVSASSRLCHPSHQVLEKAKDINRVRFGHGDDPDRLTSTIQTIHYTPVTDVRNPDWSSHGDLQFSPLTAMAAAAQCRRQVVGAPPVQMWMPTIGRTVEMGKILDVCTSYRGPPCTITSPNVNPPGCEMLSDHFDRLNICRVHLMRQIAQAPEAKKAEMETRLSSLHNEHSILAGLVCCANSRLIGPWRDEWQPPYELGPKMPAIWESLKLKPEQRRQLWEMREQARDIIVSAKSAHFCSLDMAAELARSSPSAMLYSTADNIALLDMVEAAEQARFMVPATEFMTGQAALSNILSPLQSARFVIATRMLYMAIPGLRYEAVDFVRFIAACFLDEELSAWLDDAQPPPWTLES